MENQTTLVPLPADLPDFNAAMAKLGRVPLVLYQALEYGAAKTAAYRDTEFRDERLDDGLAATMLRCHAKRFLGDAGIDAQLEDEWALDSLPFLGLAFHYAGYHVRILKGVGGVLPGCGTSKKKIAFYGQIASMYLIGNTPAKTSANLLALWDFDGVYGLSGLWLALPAIGGARTEEVSAFWCERIPHPTEGIRGITPPPTPPTDDLSGLVVPIDGGKSKSRINER